jgi:hypothetical protein
MVAHPVGDVEVVAERGGSASSGDERLDQMRSSSSTQLIRVDQVSATRNTTRDHDS